MTPFIAKTCLIFGIAVCATNADRAEYVRTQNWEKLNEQCSLAYKGVIDDENFELLYCNDDKVNVDAVKQAKGK